MKETRLQFPKGFFWGAASSSYQIEGGITNDWSEWERSAGRLGDLEARGLSPAVDFQSGLASNSWEHLEADIAALKKLGATAYRFSIEWARVEPREGQFDAEAIARYAGFIRRLKEEGIEPFVTLWHWPIPLWLRDRGGWTNRGIIKSFVRYAEMIARSCSGVRFWGTLNEPNVYTAHGYLSADWPPQQKSKLAYWRATRLLIRAHRAAYQALKRINPDFQIGITSHQIYFQAGDAINRLIVRVIDWWWNHYFFNRIASHQDYVGVNYYRRRQIRYGLMENSEGPISDMGWELYPEGLYQVVRGVSRYNKPIYIMEHGLADEKDAHRAWYIRESLTALHRAIAEGSDVRGYLHWSLLDNFEWAHGFGPKFGLFAVNRSTWERMMRPSAETYAEIIRHNGL